MTVFVVQAYDSYKCTTTYLAGVATSYTGAVDMAWKDAEARRDTFDGYVIIGTELDTPGFGLHNTYFDLGDSERGDVDAEWFRDNWETLGGMKVPYENPRKIVPS